MDCHVRAFSKAGRNGVECDARGRSWNSKKAGNWAAWTVALRFAHTLSVMKLKWLIDTQTDSKRPYCDNGVFWDGRSKTLKARGSAFAVNYGSVIPKTTSKEKQKAVRSKNIVQYTH